MKNLVREPDEPADAAGSLDSRVEAAQGASGCSLAASGFVGELGALCSAAKNFVSAAKTQEGILITYSTASAFAASTIAYAAAKERYFSEFRAAMPMSLLRIL